MRSGAAWAGAARRGVAHWVAVRGAQSQSLTPASAHTPQGGRRENRDKRIAHPVGVDGRAMSPTGDLTACSCVLHRSMS